MAILLYSGDIQLQIVEMARGQQKIQSQQKNAERQAKLKKAQSSKRAENKALIYSCTVCKVSIFFLFLF